MNLKKIFFLLSIINIVSYRAYATEQSSAFQLSESNQWVFDRPIGFIQFAIEDTSVFNDSFETPRFKNIFEPGSWKQLLFDSQTRFAQFEISSFWYDYSVGLLQKNGHLYDTINKLNLPLESTNIVSIPFKLGLEWQWDYSSWFIPSIGYNVGYQGFRISSSMSGAEVLGQYFYHGPLFHIKLKIPSSHLTFSMQSTQKNYMSGDSEFFRKSVDYTLGVGWLY